jgi:endonuclease G
MDTERIFVRAFVAVVAALSAVHAVHFVIRCLKSAGVLAVLLLPWVPLNGADPETPTLANPLTRWGTPEGTVHHEGTWCFAFDGRTRCARWALEYLSDVPTAPAERNQRFFADLRIPIEFRPHPADYQGSPWDRGHLVPVGNLLEDSARAATFSLANACPQHPSLNRGLWRSLESHVRAMANDQYEVWAITLPVWRPIEGRVAYGTIGKAGVAVPTHFGKSLLRMSRDEIAIYSWLAPNAKPGEADSLDGWRVTTDELEHAAGLDFWSALPDESEKRLEAIK